MEHNLEQIIFIVVSSSVTALLAIAVVIDLIVLYRKRKRYNEQEREMHKKEVDHLLRMEEMRRITAEMEGQAAERERIAQDLHDQLGSLLFTTKLHFKHLGKSIPEDQKKAAEGISTMLDEAHQEVRRISHDLHEGAVYDKGFIPALEHLVEAIRSSSRIKVTLDVSNVTSEQLAFVQTDLFNIIQELFSNTLKYAKARSIRLKLEDHSGKVLFTYEDDGLGFEMDQSSGDGGIGLNNIRNRAAKIGTDIELRSEPGKGMSFSIILNNE